MIGFGFGFALEKTKSDRFLLSLLVLFQFCSPALSAIPFREQIKYDSQERTILKIRWFSGSIDSFCFKWVKLLISKTRNTITIDSPHH